MANSTAEWPELDWNEWKDTADTLHMWTQIVGKTRLALTPLQNHWWNVPLYVSARGLTTSAMHWRGALLEVEFDFAEHVLRIRMGGSAERTIELRPRTVADFYAEYMQVLGEMGVTVRIWPVPVEVASPIRFTEDTQHASYDRGAVERYHAVLVRVDALLKRFATGFQGKISPVHFFWGSFDLAVTRFNGKLAGGPPKPDRMQQEAYSHEVSSAGFWPGNGGFGQAAFYSYAAPVPVGMAERAVAPGGWNAGLGEFVLLYDEVRCEASPEDAVMRFLESTYAAAADAAGWDRGALERPVATAKWA